MRVVKMDDVHYANLNCKIEKSSEKEGKQQHTFVASTPEPDHDGDIIDLQGWDTAEWEKNPVILWGHDRKAPPIGKGLSVTKDTARNALVINMEFVPKDIYPFAGLISDLTNHGYLKGVSVGFKPISFEERTDIESSDSWFPPLHFTKQKLLELSVVNVPANPSALLITNSVQREMLYSKGVFPGQVQKLIFAEPDIAKCKEWAKSHDFITDKITMDNGAHIFEQAPEETFENTRTVLLEKGIKAIIGRVKKEELSVTNKTIIQVPEQKDWSLVGLQSYEKNFIDQVGFLNKSIGEQTKVLGELKDVVKGLATLAEALSEKETGTPGIKPDRLSEQYLNGLNASALELGSIFKSK